jgi:tetratricopeptide (TPR) repeat protein
VEVADALRRQGELDGAVGEYTQALGLDPRCPAAYLGRGIARWRKRDHAGALEDLDAAARLDPARAEAFFHRGRVHLELARHDRAAADFAAARRLNPASAVAGYYLAVALRQAGQTGQAVSTLTDLLRQHPGDARLYWQRGAAHADRADWPQALADLTRAVELAPGLAEARQRLAEVRRSLPPAPPAGPPAPRKREVPAGLLALSCPGCGAAGNVRVDRLDHVFQCKGCRRLFHVYPSGRLDEVKDPRAGRGRHRPRRRLGRAGVVALLLGLAAVAGWRWTRAPAATVAEASLPAELEARAELFVRAWLAEDLPGMRRLTDRARDRQLYPWVLAHKPPPVGRPDAGDGADPLAGVAVRLRVEKTGTTTARVVAHVEGLPSRNSSLPPALTQEWAARGDVWYFVPPDPARRPGPGLKSPPTPSRTRPGFP